MAWRPYPLHDPPQLSRLIVGGLPKLGAQLVMLHRVGTYQDELWLAGGLGVDGIELRPGLTDEDQFATDFNIKVRHRNTCHRHPTGNSVRPRAALLRSR